jgi:hypothetical protein
MLQKNIFGQVIDSLEETEITRSVNIPQKNIFGQVTSSLDGIGPIIDPRRAKTERLGPIIDPRRSETTNITPSSESESNNTQNEIGLHNLFIPFQSEEHFLRDIPYSNIFGVPLSLILVGGGLYKVITGLKSSNKLKAFGIGTFLIVLGVRVFFGTHTITM